MEWDESGWPATVRETVLVEEHTYLIDRPDESEMYRGFNPARPGVPYEEMPYWSDLWPAARMLAKVLQRESFPPGLKALEVGCGLGLPGVVALARGMRVVFSDAHPLALRYAERNALLNGFDQFEVLRLDWRHPPAELRVEVVLGSDLIYEIDNVAPLIGLIKQVLLPAGQCLLTDQERVPGFVVQEALTQAGLTFTTQTLRAGQPGGRRVKGTLYRIQHAG
jgi:predicted nicotinamide N-methyase